MNKKIKNIFLFIACLLGPLLIGLIGAYFTSFGSSEWYLSLNKPTFSPNQGFFSGAWIVVYVFLGLSLFVVLKDDLKDKLALRAKFSFIAQLFLSLYWLFLFFFAQMPSLAFWAFISFLAMVIVNCYYFFQIKKTAAYLFLPYLTWIIFSGVLNYFIWQLN